MKPVRTVRHLAVESLESRHLLSVAGASETVFDPSSLEQEMLEHLYRFNVRHGKVGQGTYGLVIDIAEALRCDRDSVDNIQGLVIGRN